jgi:hypothetical protein
MIERQWFRYADSKQDTSTVEIGREFAVVGPIFPFMENFAPANLLAYAPGRVLWPRVSSRLFLKLQSFPKQHRMRYDPLLKWLGRDLQTDQRKAMSCFRGVRNSLRSKLNIRRSAERTG